MPTQPISPPFIPTLIPTHTSPPHNLAALPHIQYTNTNQHCQTSKQRYHQNNNTSSSTGHNSSCCNSRVHSLFESCHCNDNTDCPNLRNDENGNEDIESDTQEVGTRNSIEVRRNEEKDKESGNNDKQSISRVDSIGGRTTRSMTKKARQDQNGLNHQQLNRSIPTGNCIQEHPEEDSKDMPLLAENSDHEEDSDEEDSGKEDSDSTDQVIDLTRKDNSRKNDKQKTTHQDKERTGQRDWTREIYAFADDLAIASAYLEAIIDAFAVIDEFRVYSGLGINTDKTKILTRKKPTDADRAMIANCTPNSWRKVQFTTKYKYLGVLMGMQVNTNHIFEEAMDKFRIRTNSYRPYMAALSMQTKIIIANVFLLSVFSYLIQYFIIPKTVWKEARNLIHRLIVPFNGSAIAYVHLTTPKHCFGFHQPLRDLWATGLARLASLSPMLTAHNNSYIAASTKRPYLSEPGWRTLLIEDHRDAAALEYLNFYRQRPACGPYKGHIFTDNLIGLAPKTSRPVIYQETVLQGWAKQRWSTGAAYDKTIPASLPAIFLKKGFPPTALDHYIQAAEHILPAMPACYRSLQIRMVHNALPTDHRRSRANMPTSMRGHDKANPHPCHFCGSGVDRTVHIFSECGPILEARKRYFKAIDIPTRTSWQTTCLAGPLTTQKHEVNAIIIFNYTVWNMRERVYSFPHKTTTLPTMIREIANFASEKWHRIVPVKHRPRSPHQIHTHTPVLLWPTEAVNPLNARRTHIHTTRWKQQDEGYAELLGTDHTQALGSKKHSEIYGNSKNRSSDQKLAALQEAIRLVGMAPPNAALCFCDGSAIPNPGPCGTGVVVHIPIPGKAVRLRVSASRDLGYGSNNIGELWGPAMCLAVIEVTSKAMNFIFTGPIYIYSDSVVTINALMYHSMPTANKLITLAVKDYLFASPNPISCYWVAGHADIEDNELADEKAKDGALLSASTARGPLPPQGIHSNPFMPPATDIMALPHLCKAITEARTSLSLHETTQSLPKPTPLICPPLPTEEPAIEVFDVAKDDAIVLRSNLMDDKLINACYARLRTLYPKRKIYDLWEAAKAQVPLQKRRRTKH